MAYYIFLKTLRSLEEFRKNSHVKIPPKSPSTKFQSLSKFKNTIFNSEILFPYFRPDWLRTVMLLPMPPGRPSHHGSIATRAGCRTRSTTSYLTGRRINSRPTGWKRIFPGWRWYTTRMWWWSWALVCWPLSTRLRLFVAVKCRHHRLRL
jgi:hypothetical protein